MRKRIGLRWRFFALLGYFVFTLLLVAVLLEFASFVALNAYHWVRPETQDNFADTSPAYSAYPWAREFWREEHSRWKSQPGRYEPFRIWGVAPWRGKYINTDDTADGTWRRTINPANCEKASALEVWMFGGSTLYGTGVPDWATIPSFLSRDLNSSGLGCFLVTNFGAEGYVTNQEVMLLMERLKAGRRPAIVISYDGVNDSYAGVVSPGIPRAHLSYANIGARVEGSLAGRLDFLRNSYALQLVVTAVDSLRPPTVTKPMDGELESKAAATVDNYEANLEIAKTLGKTYGFQLFSFWQPALVSGHKPLAPFEMSVASSDGAKRSFPIMSVVYQQAAQRSLSDGAFIFLGDILDSTKDPVYLDKWMHLAPSGNELVARSIAQFVESNLDALRKAR
jgi:hypothetical protein